jgi:hypothetical protein
MCASSPPAEAASTGSDLLFLPFFRCEQGVFLQFNASLAVSPESDSTAIPWIAYIPCDSSYSLYNTSNVSSVNSSSISAANGTSSASAASASASATSASANGTTSANSTSSTLETLDLIERAQGLGATAVVLYSQTTEVCPAFLLCVFVRAFPRSSGDRKKVVKRETHPFPYDQSCTLNYTVSTNTSSTFLSNSTLASSSNITLPIFTTPTNEIASLLLQQFSNLPASHVYFNSTLLTLSTANLTSVLQSYTSSNASASSLASTLTTPVNYVLARLTPSYASNSSDNGVVATIGRATPSASATGNVGGGNGGTSGAAPRIGGVAGGTAVAVFAGGAIAAGLAVLV